MHLHLQVVLLFCTAAIHNILTRHLVEYHYGLTITCRILYNWKIELCCKEVLLPNQLGTLS